MATKRIHEPTFNGVVRTGNEFHAYLSVETKTLFIGTYKSPDDATAAYNTASRTLRAAYQRIAPHPHHRKRLVTT
jgi:hypothetical protein